MTTKRLFLPITKVDAAKGIVYGILASEVADRAGETFDYAGSKPYFEKWSESIHKATDGKSFGNLRSMHGQVAAGKLTQMAFNDDEKQIEVAAKVVDANELNKVLEGVYTGFSIGGKYVTRKKEGDTTRYVADPYEASLVDLPCIPNATFEVIKAEGAQPEVRKFHAPEAPTAKPAPTNAEITVEAERLAKVAGDETKWPEHIEAARKSLTAAEPAEIEPKHVLEIAVTAVDEQVAKNANGEADDLGAVQQWTHARLPGQGFTKKADLRQALADLDAAEKAKTLAAPVTDALKAVTDALDTKDPAGVAKNKSDNPDFASGDKGGDKSGKDKKPAPTGKDAKTKAKEEADKDKPPMKSAVDVIARAKAWQAEKVPSFVERREILKAAAGLNALAALPVGFIDVIEEPLEKMAGFNADMAKSATLYSVSNLIGILASLDSLEDQMENSAPDWYGSGTTRIDVSPETMTAVRTALTALGGACSTLLDEVLSAMTAEEAEKALGRGTVLGGLFKIGARNSKADQTRLSKAHDLLAEINPEMCGGTKSAGDGDLEKVLAAERTAFTKTLGDIGDALKDVAERVKRIEAQPVAGRPSHVNVVEKGTEIARIIDGNVSERSESKRANEEAYAMMAGEATRFSLPQR